jgi:DNA-binding MarR family transcriptional regulator
LAYTNHHTVLIAAKAKVTTMAQKETDMRHSLSLIHETISRILGLQKGKKSGLSPVAIAILYQSHVKRLQVTDISRLYDVKKSTASGYVDNLEKKGYAKRVKDEKNRRNTYVEPTEKGKKWMLSKEKVLAEYIQKHMANLTHGEQEQFIDLLSKYVKE